MNALMTPSNPDDTFSALFAPEAAAASSSEAQLPWKVLLVDDEADIHAVIRLALTDMLVEGRPLQLFDAGSAAEARTVLAENPDIALILLDVIMETKDAGLVLVKYLRQQLCNRMVRIILLTGQPGYTPQREVVRNYEIDDYRLKSGLTSDILFTCVYSALRTYQALQNLEQKRTIEQLAIDLHSANQRLNREVAERKGAQDLAETQMQNLVRLNQQLEDAHNQLLQSEKLASIGLLAAGVAHEINNPIGFVNSNLGTLNRHIGDLLAIIAAYEAAEASEEPDSAIRFSNANTLKIKLELDYLKTDILALLAESQEGLVRVKKIVQSLKDFSRIERREACREDDLQQGIEATLSVVWNALKYKCEVRKEYGDLPLIECVLSELNQVFMNLLVNASHAIEERGVVSIRTGSGEDEVWVEISDTGTGIAPENLSRIFDPFYTTKPVGQGTGLGLSLSYGIVEKHHGRIEVESELGKGTTFRIWLPIHQPADQCKHCQLSQCSLGNASTGNDIP